MANYLDGIAGGKHNSDNSEALVPIKTFTVSVTFTDMIENTPLGAAKKACKWLKEDASTMIYEVTDENTGEESQIDLSLEDITA